MNKLLIAAFAVSIISTSAIAASSSGVVARFNADTRVITLENGNSYTVPRDVAIPALQIGEKVSIHLNDEGDKVRAILK